MNSTIPRGTMFTCEPFYYPLVSLKTEDGDEFSPKVNFRCCIGDTVLLCFLEKELVQDGNSSFKGIVPRFYWEKTLERYQPPAAQYMEVL